MTILLLNGFLDGCFAVRIVSVLLVAKYSSGELD